VNDTPHPLIVHVGATTSEDYTKFANQVRAAEYCDRSGQHCTDAAGGGSSNEVVFEDSSKAISGDSYQSCTGCSTKTQVAFYFDQLFETPPTIVGLSCFGALTVTRSGVIGSYMHVSGSHSPGEGCTAGPNYIAGGTLSSDFTVGEPGWYPNLSSYNFCTQLCAVHGLTSATDPATGGKCLSGEHRLSDSDSHKYAIEYEYGKFGDGTSLGTTVYGPGGDEANSLCAPIVGPHGAGSDDYLVGCYCN